MKDTIIVSGGNIHKDFALDFLKKEQNREYLSDRSRPWRGILYGNRSGTGCGSGRL